ncbi:MAG: hypothetical protein QM763_10705 [Agriterribacter sp.]
MFNKYEWRIVVRITVLFITLCITAFFLVKGSNYYIYLTICIPAIIVELIDFFSLSEKGAG